MSKYFEQEESSYHKLGNDVKGILEDIASRYMGTNIPNPFVFRVSSERAFKRKEDYRYNFDLNKVYLEAKNEQIVYAWAKLWSKDNVETTFSASVYGPMRVYLNNEIVYKSSSAQEKNSSLSSKISLKLLREWNNFTIEFIKTPLGFGGVFGTGNYKNFPLNFFVPVPEKEGQEGWITSEVLSVELEKFPILGDSEQETGIRWYPEVQWNKEEMKLGQLERIYGIKDECVAFGWVKANFTKKGTNSYVIKGIAKSPLKIYIGENQVYNINKVGDFEDSIEVLAGTRDIIVGCMCENNQWGFELEILEEAVPVELINPCLAKGVRDPWMYVGAFNKHDSIDIQEIKKMDCLYNCVDGKSYWRVDMIGMCIRPFLENKLFGKWNYPLGVTLYGLLQTGLILERNDIIDYVKRHVEICSAFYEYSLWDKDKFGAAGINNQISAVDSLDDCGSFASLMLELQKNVQVNGYRKVADDVAEYISTKQSRLVDGALYRSITKMSGMEGTMWVDDLYMSVPFLVRYYKLTGEQSYIDDAANQYLLYKKYMFIPELKIMSHVYYTSPKMANGIPWGRGNGWVLFSLSELLAVLPKDHKCRNELLSFFRELCEGYLVLQNKKGMWHQVLNDNESYEEASCTSMFAYAFARGVRYGWLEKQEIYARSVFKAWEGLSKIAIDEFGNIYGVCKGSGSSFTPRYYKNELGWVLNDPHGTGIVMLAGIEVLQLRKWMEN